MSHPNQPFLPRPVLPPHAIDVRRHYNIAVIGDIHGNVVGLQRAVRTLQRLTDNGRLLNWLLLVGDFTGRDTRGGRAQTEAAAEVTTLLQMLQPLQCPVAFVPGNHDVVRVAHAANQDGRWTRTEHGSIVVTGIGGGGPARFGWPYEWTEEELEQYLAAAFPGGVAPGVILSHTPPFGILDRTVDGRHVGSRVLRELAEQHRGLFICGHIHEARGVHELATCTVVNAGALGNPHPWIGVTLIEGVLDAWSVRFVDADK